LSFIIFLFSWIILKYYLKKEESSSKETYQFLNRENKYTNIKIKNKSFLINNKKMFPILLILILLISFVIKLPYWDLPFVGSHPMKYSTYAEPALHMYENKDPFFFKRNYMYNPLSPSSDSESAKIFGNLPLMEWSLFSVYTIFGHTFPIEILTRLTTSIWGAIGLLSLYLFLSEILNKKIGLVAILLLAFNPIFNLASYVTVYDIITFSITFIALYFIAQYLKNGGTEKFLFWAGIISGIGIAIKSNIAIWLLPMVFILLLFNKKEAVYKRFSDISYYLLIATLPVINVLLSVSHFPSKNIKFLLLFMLFTILTILAFLIKDYLYKIVNKIIKFFLDFFNRYKIAYLLLVLVVTYGIKKLYDTTIAEEFLTNWELLINADLYRRLISEQLIPYLNVYIFSVSIFALPFLFKLSKSLLGRFLFALFLGTIIYIIFASKALFFHNYYWVVILVPFYILVSIFIFKIAEDLYKNNKFSKILVLALTISFLAVIYPSTTSKINRADDDIPKLVEYFQGRNLEEGVSYIDQASSNYILFKTKLNIVYSYEIFDTIELKNKVKEIGFAEAMRYYKIYFVIVPTETDIDLKPFANSVDFENKLQEYKIRRDIKITDSLYGKNKYYSDEELRFKLLIEHNIPDSFKKVYTNDRYTVYEILPLDDNPIE